MEEKIKRFVDEYPKESSQFEAERVEFSDIMDKDVVILDLTVMNGDYGEFLVVLGKLEGKEIQFATGSKVIVPKLKKAREDAKLPLIAKFTEVKTDKGKKYFDIE